MTVGEWESALAGFMSALSPAPIYAASTDVALRVMTMISGTLLVASLAIRMVSTSADIIREGRGKWEQFVLDLMLWGGVLGAYFGLVYLIRELFDALYNWTASNGSLSLILAQYSELIARIEYQGEPDASVLNFIADFAANIPKAIAFGVYMLSYALVLFVSAFLGIANAFAYSVAVMWGAVAIPMHLSGKLSLLRGWGLLAGTALLWPLLENLMMFFVAPLLNNAIASLQPDSSATVNLVTAGAYLGLAVVNLLISAFVIAAPLIAYTLVANAGSVTGIITPFAGGALAATGAFGSVVRSQFNRGVSAAGAGGAAAIGGARKVAGSDAINRALTASRGTTGNAPVLKAVQPPGGAGSKASSMGSVNRSSPSRNASSSSGSALLGKAAALSGAAAHAGQIESDAGTSPTVNPVEREDTNQTSKRKRSASQQNRRGAIITQQQRKGRS